LDKYKYIAVAYVLHDVTLIKLIVAGFMGRGGFLIRYSNSHAI